MKVEGGSQATADVETAITAAMASTEPIGARGTATIDDGAWTPSSLCGVERRRNGVGSAAFLTKNDGAKDKDEGARERRLSRIASS